jgi:hypothetical protein
MNITIMASIERKDTKRIDQLFILLKSTIREIVSKYLVSGINDDPKLLTKICELERLVNQTFPQTAAEHELARVLRYQLKFGRAKLTKFLFETRQASLLLLIDSTSITKALKINEVFDVRFIKGENRYSIFRHVKKSAEAMKEAKQPREKRENCVKEIMDEPAVFKKINWAECEEDD